MSASTHPSLWSPAATAPTETPSVSARRLRALVAFVVLGALVAQTVVALASSHYAPTVRSTVTRGVTGTGTNSDVVPHC